MMHRGLLPYITFFYRYQLLFLVALLVILPLTILTNPFRYQLAISTLMMATIAILLGSFANFAKRVSFGHGLFYTCGLFLPVLLIKQWDLHPLNTLWISFLANGLLGFGIYKLLSRSSQHWFSIWSFALFFAVITAIKWFLPYSNIHTGLIVPSLNLFNIDFTNKFYWYIIGSVLLLAVTTYHQIIAHSVLSPAIRQTYTAGQQEWIYTKLFMLSASVTGLIGSLMSFYAGLASINETTLIRSLEMGWISITGGLGFGLGNLIMGLFSESLLSQLANSEFGLEVFGVMAILAFVIFMKKAKDL